MNDFLIKLLKLRKKIVRDGWLMLPPVASGTGDVLSLRVEWYLEQKYGFERVFSMKELRDANFDLAEAFIQEANREIERQLNSRNE